MVLSDKQSRLIGRKLFNTADILFIIILTVMAIFLTTSIIKGNYNNRQIEIYWHDNLFRTLELDENRIIEIDDGIKLEIRDGRVRMLESTCTRQLCVKQGWSTGYPIVCVPNRILVLFSSKEKRMLITK